MTPPGVALPLYTCHTVNMSTPRLPITIDNATGEVVTCAEDANAAHPDIKPDIMSGQGFGQTRKLLDVEPFRLSPWITPELAAEEIAIGGFK